MLKKPGFHIGTTIYILFLLIARFLWMPYLGPMTVEWQYYLIRWAFYAVAIGAGNLYFYLTLTDFRMRFVPGFLIPLGIRMGLDGLIWLSVLLPGEVSITVRYLLDAAFILLAGLCVTWVDRKRKGWRLGKMSKASIIVLALLLLILLVPIIRVQMDAYRIGCKYVQYSEEYFDSVERYSMRAYILSLAVSFLAQYAMAVYIIGQRQSAGLRHHWFIKLSLFSWLLYVAVILRYLITPAYYSSFGTGGGMMKKYDEDVSFGFYYFDGGPHFYRNDHMGDIIGDGSFVTGRIEDNDHKNSVQFTPEEAWYSMNLRVNGYKVFYYSPYALFYYNGDVQELMLMRDIQSRPEDDMLTDVLKQGFLAGNFHCFEHGGRYLQKYAPDFIQPYIERFANGEFTQQELKDMEGIRPDYIQNVARRLQMQGKH